MTDFSEEAKKARAAYMRQYRKRFPERTREINRRYWQKRAEAMRHEESEVKDNAETNEE